MPELYRNKEWLYNKYRKEELSTSQIGWLCEVSRETIRKWLKKFNIHKLYQNKEWLLEKYIDKKMPSTKIGKLCNVSFQPILSHLRKFNIPIRSYSEAGNLARGNHCKLSKEAIEWINGELLGDGCLASYSGYSAYFKYGSKYLEYINYVSITLNHFGINRSGKIRIEKTTGCYSYASISYKELSPIYKKWYPKGKKIVPEDLRLSPLTCRQWYIGDGSLSHPIDSGPFIRLATYGFPVLNVKRLVEELNTLGFKTTYQPKNNIIRISVRSTKNFLNYISSCPVSCYQYKWAAN